MGYGTLDSLVESLLERIKLLENRIEKLEQSKSMQVISSVSPVTNRFRDNPIFTIKEENE